MFDLWLDHSKLPRHTDFAMPKSHQMPENYIDRLQACLRGMHCAFKGGINGTRNIPELSPTNDWHVITDIGPIRIRIIKYTDSSGVPSYGSQVFAEPLHKYAQKKKFEAIIMHAFMRYSINFNLILLIPKTMVKDARIELPQTFKREEINDEYHYYVNPGVAAAEEDPFKVADYFLKRQFVKNDPVAEYLFRRVSMDSSIPILGQAKQKLPELNQVNQELALKVCQKAKALEHCTGSGAGGLPKDEPFVFTRLDPWTLPSAHALSTGYGTMVEECKVRMGARGADFRGFKDVQPRTYTSRFMQLWMQKHNAVSQEDYFAQSWSAVLPSTYLLNVEYMLKAMHYACRGVFLGQESFRSELGSPIHFHHPFTWEGDCDIAFVRLSISACGKEGEIKQRVDVDEIVIRPCAEGFGFCRLILSEIARNCQYFGADMRINSPTKAVQGILERSFLKKIGQATIPIEEKYYWVIPHECLEDKINTSLNVHLLLAYEGRIRVPGIQRRDSLSTLVQDLVMHWIFEQPRGRTIDNLYQTLRDEIKLPHKELSTGQQKKVLSQVNDSVLEEAVNGYCVTMEDNTVVVRPNHFKKFVDDFKSTQMLPKNTLSKIKEDARSMKTILNEILEQGKFPKAIRQNKHKTIQAIKGFVFKDTLINGQDIIDSLFGAQ